jgi:septal ring factor EnvC (AmiA/AmiB activator)
MGLLLILDHGDGFMSLYGHNERLLKKAGDWVLSGEIIARVGDTGGQQKSGLYFEIRQSGNPINPNLWCKN